ncbi:hypothetical protein [Maribellus maritimus]|uniref:hypothetical protein n=1 Tax=Maribellus maritimus TaxID=2870838 RepID=UPI001EEAC462|nr:hypothetical protein [Maribellus maritimus]MCG6191139.1 hypothetical protein [Maribellus maritimus]
MKITLEKEHLVLEQNQDGQLTTYETGLSESEMGLDFSDLQEIQKLLKQEREWKISITGEKTIKYTSIGKLGTIEAHEKV